MELEKRGVPTVTIASSAYFPLIRRALDKMCIGAMVEVPHSFAGISVEAIRGKAETAFPSILHIAGNWAPASLSGARGEKPYPALRFKFTGSDDDVAALFLKRRWMGGLPVVPPAVERVEAMLKGTSLPPSEILSGQGKEQRFSVSYRSNGLKSAADFRSVRRIR